MKTVVKSPAGSCGTQLINKQKVITQCYNTVTGITQNENENIQHIFAFCFRFEVLSAHERTFYNTGLYYFYLEKNDADWVGDEASSICVIKVTQTNR